ncbi:MAG: hypothetical protein LC785_12550 [Acidobacteria bacterium]|nr:hypothetical protein [Acidobacteriota bacterium]MCA1642749.1 hypothetical protein [Acidobacteriota bacterium]
MRLSVAKKIATLLASLVLTGLATDRVSTAQLPLPNPVLVFTGQEFFQSSGKQRIRYRFTVDNSSAYPNELFAAAPDLPPCGSNTKASRTWVDLYDQGGKRLYGFCAFGSSNDLSQMWFALDADVIPPSWIYIELTDRKTNTKYKSNLAETTM